MNNGINEGKSFSLYLLQIIRISYKAWQISIIIGTIFD